jgi:predicted MFS family arabinose efflux permease
LTPVSNTVQSGDPFQGKAVVSLIGLLMLGLVDNQILSPILPEIASSFRVGVGRVGVTVSGYALAAAAAALIVGPLSDRLSRRPFLVGAGVTFGLASLGAFVSPSFLVFASARVLAGASAGVISALVVASIADRVPYGRRGRAMGWVASAYFAAPILGVPVGSWLADQFGWRALYVLFAGMAALLALALTVWLMERPREPSEVGSLGRPSAFVGYGRFLKNKVTAAGAVSAFFVSGGISGFIVYLGAYLQREFGLSLTAVGMVFLLSGAASLVGALGAGRLSDRVGKRAVAIWGSVALGGLILAVPFLGGGLPLYAGLGLVGLAAASRVAPLQSLVTELVSREVRGAYVALRNTLSQLGIAVAAAAGASLFAWRGFTAVCILAGIFSLVAALILRWVEEPAA